MSAPNRSQPGQGENERPSSASPSGSSHPGLEASSNETQPEALRSLLSTRNERFEALSSEIQEKVLRALDWLLLSQETQDKLEVKRRAKQAEANARHAEADWLAKAIRSMEEGDEGAVGFVHSVLLSNDDERGSPGQGSDAN